MCFYRALCHVQIASDFRIVTALKQQVDDLPLPLSYFTKHLFHAFTSTDAPGMRQHKQLRTGPMRTPQLLS